MVSPEPHLHGTVLLHRIRARAARGTPGLAPEPREPGTRAGSLQAGVVVRWRTDAPRDLPDGGRVATLRRRADGAARGRRGNAHDGAQTHSARGYAMRFGIL